MSLSKKKLAEKFLKRYLSIAPVGLALWRSVEAKHLATVRMERPILDIGCGFGEFASAFVDEGDYIDMGVDTAIKDLMVASKGKKYKNLLLADARDLPFPKDTFATIISISSLEHIIDVEKCLKEAFRVLKPDGILAITMETDEVDRQTFYRPFFRKIGLGFFSNLLTKMYNTLFHRHSLLPKQRWIQKVEKAGFVIDVAKDIISPSVTRLFDIFLLTSWPSQLFRPFTGKRIVYRPAFINSYILKLFLPYVEEDEKEGTNLFVVARKPRRKK